jgi:hypothetical protein
MSRANIFNKKRWLNIFSISLLFLFLLFTLSLLQGCARWPNGNGNGNGNGGGVKKLMIQVYFDGPLDPENGQYYIAMRPDPTVLFAPGNEVNSWQDGDYYILYDSFEFSLNKVVEGSESNEDLGILDPIIEDKNIRITLDLSDIGNPNKIYTNVVTTDSLNNTLDYLDDQLVIDTSTIPSTQSFNDAQGDTEDSSYDIIEASATIYIP